MYEKEDEIMDRINQLRDMVFLEKMADNCSFERIRKYRDEITELEVLLQGAKREK